MLLKPDIEGLVKMAIEIHNDLKNIAYELHIANNYKSQELMGWTKHDPELYKFLEKQIKEQLKENEKEEK